MVKILAPVLLAGAALAARIQDATWEAYKTKFAKSYSVQEDAWRYNTFLENKRIIAAHNARADDGLEKFWMGETPNTDMTVEEVNKLRNGYGGKHQRGDDPAVGLATYPCAHSFVPSGDAIPTDKNWVTDGAVTIVKNQMYCGDCWAFSASGCMEGARAIHGDGVLQSLSAQQVTDCASFNAEMGEYSTNGCNGGWPQNAFYYAYGVSGGIEAAKSYPFIDGDQPCLYNATKVVSTYSGCVDANVQGDETMLTTALAEVGPISVAIDAGLNSFHNYAYGIYEAGGCSSTSLDHAVLAVGYGVYPDVDDTITTECVMDDFYCSVEREGHAIKYPCIEPPSSDSGATKLTTSVPGVDCNPPTAWAGEEFYMVKNSWGHGWGMEGYIMMIRNYNNNCGIATMPSYATV